MPNSEETHAERMRRERKERQAANKTAREKAVEEANEAVKKGVVKVQRTTVCDGCGEEVESLTPSLVSPLFLCEGCHVDETPTPAPPPLAPSPEDAEDLLDG